MKTMKSLMVAGLWLGLSVGFAYGQAGGVRAKVPFRFSVAGKNFAPGEYMMVPGSHLVTVVSLSDGKTVALALANKISGRAAGENGRILFHCYRDRCFLSEIWSTTEENGRQVLTSRAEADLAKEGAGTFFAVLGSKPRD